MITVTQSPILSETAQAGTKEWLEVSKNMIILAYVGTRAAVPPSAPTVEDEEPAFGTHIKETVEASKRLFGKKIE